MSDHISQFRWPLDYDHKLFLEPINILRKDEDTKEYEMNSLFNAYPWISGSLTW